MGFEVIPDFLNAIVKMYTLLDYPWCQRVFSFLRGVTRFRGIAFFAKEKTYGMHPG